MLKKYSPQTTISENGITKTEMVEEMLGAWIPAKIGQEMYDYLKGSAELFDSEGRYEIADEIRAILSKAEGGSDVLL